MTSCRSPSRLIEAVTGVESANDSSQAGRQGLRQRLTAIAFASEKEKRVCEPIDSQIRASLCLSFCLRLSYAAAQACCLSNPIIPSSLPLLLLFYLTDAVRRLFHSFVPLSVCVRLNPCPTRGS